MQKRQKGLRMPSLGNESLHHPIPGFQVTASLLTRLHPSLSHPILSKWQRHLVTTICTQFLHSQD